MGRKGGEAQESGGCGTMMRRCQNMLYGLILEDMTMQKAEAGEESIEGKAENSILMNKPTIL